MLLDLDHRALARLVRLVEPLGDDPVERATGVAEPSLGELAVGGDRREQQARRGGLGHELFKCLPSLGQRLGGQISRAQLQTVEQHQLRRRFARQPADPRCRRMKPHLQGSERQRLAYRQHQFAIEHEALLLQREQCLDDLREITPQRLSRFRHQRNVLAIAEREAAKAIPLGFELPALTLRNPGGKLGFHRRGIERDRHVGEMPGACTEFRQAKMSIVR